MVKKRDTRDTYKYHVIKDRKIVHRGVTEDIGRRAREHQQEFPNSHVKPIGRRTTRKAALEWERKGGKRSG